MLVTCQSVFSFIGNLQDLLQWPYLLHALQQWVRLPVLLPSTPPLTTPLHPCQLWGCQCSALGFYTMLPHELYSHNTSSKIKLFKTLKVVTSEH